MNPNVLAAATARREGAWWVVDVSGIGVTQAARSESVDEMARDLVAAMLDVPMSGVTVITTYKD